MVEACRVTFPGARGFPAAMKCFLALVFTSVSLHAATATDWPRFLGPTGAAIVAESKAPLKWSDSENIVWKAEMPGPGSSSPIVFGDKVFITCWTGYGDKEGANDIAKLTRHLICLNRADGKIVWEAKVPSAAAEDPWQGFITEHGYATHTPVTDGEHVYVFFGKSGALAFDMTGKQLWQTSCGTGSGRMRWGSGASPILVGDLLIVNASDEAQAIIGIDKKSGKIMWKAEGEFGMAYGTPNVFQRDGVTDLVIAVPQELWGLNPETGKLRWYATHGLPGNVSPALIQDGDVVYLYGGYPTAGSAGIRLGGKGDVTSTNMVWQSKSSSYVPTPVLHEGHLYVVNDGGFALCMEAKTGKDVYRERVMEGGGRGRGGKPFYASPVLIGDKLYAVSRRNGTYILAAKPTFEKIATIPPLDDSQMNATPAVVGNKLLLRSEKAVYCVSAEK